MNPRRIRILARIQPSSGGSASIGSKRTVWIRKMMKDPDTFVPSQDSPRHALFAHFLDEIPTKNLRRAHESFLKFRHLIRSWIVMKANRILFGHGEVRVNLRQKIRCRESACAKKIGAARGGQAAASPNMRVERGLSICKSIRILRLFPDPRRRCG